MKRTPPRIGKSDPTTTLPTNQNAPHQLRQVYEPAVEATLSRRKRLSTRARIAARRAACDFRGRRRQAFDGIRSVRGLTTLLADEFGIQKSSLWPFFVSSPFKLCFLRPPISLRFFRERAMSIPGDRLPAMKRFWVGFALGVVLTLFVALLLLLLGSRQGGADTVSRLAVRNGRFSPPFPAAASGGDLHVAVGGKLENDVLFTRGVKCSASR